MRRRRPPLVRALDAQGFDVRLNKRGHWVVRRDGLLLTTLAASPSDRRAMKNAVSVLRRHGFEKKGSLY